MGRHVFNIDVDAPREHVFDLWTDLGRLAEWIPSATRVSDATGTGDQPGTHFRVWFGGLAEEHEVLAAERPYYVRTRITLGTIRAVTMTTFEAIDGTTRLRQSVVTRTIAASAWARILTSKRYWGGFAAELANFCRIAEREAMAELARVATAEPGLARLGLPV